VVSVFEALGIFLAGLAAGTINTVVGSGTLITFPTLLFFGYPPVVANVSNTVGLVAGGVTAVHGYRAELEGAGRTVKRLAPASLLGGVIGAVLLLVLPAEAFQAIVPVLIGLGLVLVLLGPRLQARAAARHEAGVAPASWHGVALTAGVLVAGIYGGYFGAAQGILLVGLMSMVLSAGIQRITAIKNVLATTVNAVAALIFVIVARDQIDWRVVGLISAGTFVGGYLGARIGRRLSPKVLRAIILVIGVLALVKILFFD
jgi:uncharacterized membrane protein YfcA